MKIKFSGEIDFDIAIENPRPTKLQAAISAHRKFTRKTHYDTIFYWLGAEYPRMANTAKELITTMVRTGKVPLIVKTWDELGEKPKADIQDHLIKKGISKTQARKIAEILNSNPAGGRPKK